MLLCVDGVGRWWDSRRAVVKVTNSSRAISADSPERRSLAHGLPLAAHLFYLEDAVAGYWARITSTGSIRVARSAGTQTAATATSTRMTVTIANTGGSTGSTR